MTVKVQINGLKEVDVLKRRQYKAIIDSLIREIERQ